MVSVNAYIQWQDSDDNNKIGDCVADQILWMARMHTTTALDFLLISLKYYIRMNKWFNTKRLNRIIYGLTQSLYGSIKEKMFRTYKLIQQHGRRLIIVCIFAISSFVSHYTYIKRQHNIQGLPSYVQDTILKISLQMQTL